MTNYQRLLAGLCVDCDNTLECGPLTHDQIEEAGKDMGISIEEFSDVCDDCFVQDIARGDVKYAEYLLSRPMKLRKPGIIFQVLLGGRYD